MRATASGTSSRASRSATDLLDGLGRGVAPKLLEAVIAARIRREDVDHGVQIVHEDPARLGKPLDPPRKPAVDVLQLLVDRVVDGLHLALGIAGAEHEVFPVTDDLAQVEDADVLPDLLGRDLRDAACELLWRELLDFLLSGWFGHALVETGSDAP